MSIQQSLNSLIISSVMNFILVFNSSIWPILYLQILEFIHSNSFLFFAYISYLSILSVPVNHVLIQYNYLKVHVYQLKYLGYVCIGFFLTFILIMGSNFLLLHIAHHSFITYQTLYVEEPGILGHTLVLFS